MKRLISILVCAVAFTTFTPGCCTVTPARVEASAPSFDEGGATSGILELTKDGATVTPRLRERYNSLIKLYGAEFVPELEKDFGLKPMPDGKSFYMSNEALDNFLIMNQWRKMGRASK